MKEFYLNQLDKQQQKVYQIIKSGVESLAAEFDVPLMDKEMLSDIFYRLRLDVPEIFYASTFRYSFYPDSSYVNMKPEYLFEKNKIKEHQNAMKSRVEKLIRDLKSKTKLEQVLWIHDFICENVVYDKLKKQYSHEIMGPLGQGVGVCEGIAKSVKILCDKLQIPALVVISENNPDKNIKYRHAWNLIQLNGIWYHLDATFDLSLGKKEVRYDYFCLNDKSMYKDHEPSIYPLPACTDGDHFYYKEKKLSFTKMEDVQKRCQQAVKKGKVLTFHWRGGYLTKEILEEIFSIVAKEGKEKGMHSKVSYNWAQAVFRISYRIESTKDEVLVEDANEEESE